MLRKLTILPLFAAILAVASTASAQNPAAESEMPGQGYAYDFPDDPLTALGNGATGATVRVRQSVVRRTLMRPRLHFVPEMLNSVENI